MPAKKRRRDDAETPNKRRREQQRTLSELNVDELCIIFVYLYPIDLLNLARTCKSLRAILMHKSSLFLWTNALRQIEGLPPCPPDLTEPEYTNIMFSSRCHGCDTRQATMLWNIRRRYCPYCRGKCLVNVRYCDSVIKRNRVLPSDRCKVHGAGEWVDRDQMVSFMREYRSSSNKKEFLTEKRKQYETITLHASQCELWYQRKGQVRVDIEELRKKRRTSIFDRLRQRGYMLEVAYFGDSRAPGRETIEGSFKSVFKKHEPLTDSEWDQMWPKWVKIMNNLRIKRLEATVYQSRRRSLVSEYNSYVTRPSANTSIFDLLPYVADLASSPPFQEIIMAPEEAQMDQGLFASAFLQLPELAGEWRKQLDDQVAELVKIPPHLALEGVPSGRVMASDKLRLACVLFYASGNGLFPYPEVFLTMRYHPHRPWPEDTSKHGGPSYLNQLGIGVLDEAPYIVHACGLDPHVATMHDMDQRNARLRCLHCKNSFALVMDWRNAMLHARCVHGWPNLRLSERWQLVSDEHIDAIQTAEGSIENVGSLHDYGRCLLCQPRIGDAMNHPQIVGHLQKCHGVELKDPERGVHYEHLGFHNRWIHVEMVEEGGQVIFRKPRSRP